MKTSTKVVGMKSDLKGRVKNTVLAKTNVLLPLFEAIVNSIQAIEDIMPLEKGSINIELHRDVGEFRRVPSVIVCSRYFQPGYGWKI
ncbi:MAG: hypothetical protein MJE63_03650 [Proteobacteria bacterium]|nr:hypothetical protein [Pseudomonadota bacterium]